MGCTADTFIRYLLILQWIKPHNLPKITKKANDNTINKQANELIDCGQQQSKWPTCIY